MRTRLPIVGVMGSGVQAHEDLAAPLGRWLATRGVHLLTGGGYGVMEAISRAFCSVEGRKGATIGVLPDEAGYPNAWIEIPIFTHLPLTGIAGIDPLSRNHINVLSSAVVVALPGAAGTSSEVHLARRYGRPVIAFVRDRGEIPELPGEVEATADLGRIQRFVEEHIRAIVPGRHEQGS